MKATMNPLFSFQERKSKRLEKVRNPIYIWFTEFHSDGETRRFSINMRFVSFWGPLAV